MDGFITDQEAIACLDYIRDNAKLYAKAKAERVYLSEFRKSKIAILVQKAKDGTVQEKDAYARAHPEYLELLEGLRKAVEEEESYKWRLVAAQVKLEVYRTISANNRRATQ